MRLRLIHRERSDYAAAVRDFKRELGVAGVTALEELDPDSAEGSEVVRLYGVSQYPAVVVTTSDGVMSFMSQGVPLPLVREVQYYVGR